MATHVLLVGQRPDDLSSTRHAILQELPRSEIVEISTPAEFEDALAGGGFQLVVMDQRLDWAKGSDLSKAIESTFPGTPVVLLTGPPEEPVAVAADQGNADDYLVRAPKPLRRLPLSVLASLDSSATRRRAAHIESRIRSLLDRVRVGVFQARPDGTLLEVNRGFLRMLRRDHLVPETGRLHDFAVFPDAIADRLARVAGTRRSESTEIELRRSNGETFTAVMTLHAAIDPSGAPLVDGFVDDVTEQKQNQRALHETRMRQAALLTSLPIILYTVRSPEDPSTTWISRNVERVTGMSRDMLLLDPHLWHSRIHHEDQERVRSELRAVMNGRPVSMVYRWRNVRGDLQWFLDHATLFAEGRGRTEVIGSRIDITDRKRVEEKAREMTIALENAVEGISRVAADGRYAVANCTFARLFGCEPVGLLDLHWRDLIHEADRPIALDAHLRMLQAGKAEAEVRIARPDGTVLPVRLTLVAVPPGESSMSGGFYCFAEDISEQHAAREALRVKTEQLQAIAEAMSRFLSTDDWREASATLLREAIRQTGSEYGFIGVIVDGPVLRILAHEGIQWDTSVDSGFFDEALRRYRELGYLEFRSLENLFGRVITTRGTIVSNAPASDERAGGLPPGHPPLRAFLGVPMLRAGQALGMIGIANRPGGYSEAQVEQIELLCRAGCVLYDSYRRKQDEAALEEQVRQLQKMDAIGRIAGGVAHDFNNILTVMNGYADLLLQETPVDHPWRRRIHDLRKAGARGADLTRQLLAFSRKQVLAVQRIDLNQVLTGMESMLQRLLGENILLRLTLPKDLWPVEADPTQVEQVILNLAVNARDAMPHGGKLLIETANSPSSPSSDVEGPLVVLAVMDTGCGMDASTLARIFEPFFTTKPKGKGTGLGLSTVYGIVKQSGGVVSVQSEPGQGATFKVYLPRALGRPDRKDTTRIKLPTPRGEETVLLVEDDALVRELTREFLQVLGYRVLVAESVEQAFAIATGRTEPIHLLLSDVVMPEMNGPELARKLRQSRPDLRCLFMSGYSEGAAATEHGLDPGEHFVPKPFTPDILARKIRDVLAPPSSNGGE